MKLKLKVTSKTIEKETPLTGMVLKVTRKMLCVTNIKDLKIGDQLSFDLTDRGHFSATVQKIDLENKRALFLFDQSVDQLPMFETIIVDNSISLSMHSSYSNSLIKEWLETELLRAFPFALGYMIDELRLPRYDEIFGPKNQLPLMTDAKNRIASPGAWFGSIQNWWLSTQVKDLPNEYYIVTSSGELSEQNIFNRSSIRPIFWMRCE